MTDLRDYARGKPCQIRVPNICTGDPEQTVLCHVRLIGISGIGMKVPDLLGAWGCAACHAFVDGQGTKAANYIERRLLLLEAVARTQAQLIKDNVIHW